MTPACLVNDQVVWTGVETTWGASRDRLHISVILFSKCSKNLRLIHIVSNSMDKSKECRIPCITNVYESHGERPHLDRRIVAAARQSSGMLTIPSHRIHVVIVRVQHLARQRAVERRRGRLDVMMGWCNLRTGQLTATLNTRM